MTYISMYLVCETPSHKNNTKNSIMTAEKKDPGPKKSRKDGVSEEDARKESSKVAKQATEAQKKATELMKAAAAAGDPEERQKLMEQALEQQIQSKSLGKTARYLRSGTFQGMAVGAGLGIAPGASLGAITGTLVGGVTSTALGGVGAGLGAATGWMHGPFWDLGKGAGKGIQKITGNLPGWKATENQKKQLEKMVGQINEQEAPRDDELEGWTNESTSEEQKEAIEGAKSAMPSMPSIASSDEPKGQEMATKQEDQKRATKETQRGQEQEHSQGPEEDLYRSEDLTNTQLDANGDAETQGKKEDSRAHVTQESAQEIRSTYKDAAVQTQEEGRKKPRKIQSRSDNGSSVPDSLATTRKQPRKLEKRSA